VRKRKERTKKRIRIAAVSGGPDSVYLVTCSLMGSSPLLLAHYNHGARGKESTKDQKFVEELGSALGIPMKVGKNSSQVGDIRVPGGAIGMDRAGFEGKARQERHAFLQDLKKEYDAETILMGHTADDQVETILMRILEGSGIAGLRGIPRSTKNGIERPLLDIWRADILAYLKKHKIAYRVDRSNLDTRFERNWIRHVLIPLLEKKYGKSVKKRIFALGERFRELDTFIDNTAHTWLETNVIYQVKSGKSKPPSAGGQEKKAIRIPRKAYADLPSLLRIRILQILCFEHLGTAPNERLLTSMDRLIVSGGSSVLLSVGRGATLLCRYGEAVLSLPGRKKTAGAGEARFGRPGMGKEHKGRRGEEGGKAEKKKGVAEPVFKMEGPGIYWWNQPLREGGGVEDGSPVSFTWEERGKTAPGRIRKMAGGERQAAFDAELLRLPLSVRPLMAGDRVRPFGLTADKKIKEILIDRKVPREERWGRPVVCDAGGRIVWIPGVLRAADAAVTPTTRRTIVLRADVGGEPSS
jgi:tRNA(Ile)-lysidine synthase